MKLINYKAYSKINLGLQVLNLRNDGYHNINTVFYLTNLSDSIIFSTSDKIEIETKPDLGIPYEDNLIYKAGKLFLEKQNIAGGFKAVVNKNIPTGGGLGGGSSDAATTITALNRIYEKDLPLPLLLKYSEEIGSDCAFFINGSSAASASGRGEILKSLPLQLNSKIVLVNPGIHVSTPMAYKMLGRTSDSNKAINFGEILLEHSDNPKNYRGKITNDFEDVIFYLHPEIEEIKIKLYNLGADFALMSGSGSTVFGLFNNDIDLSNLYREFPDYFCHISS